MAKHESKRKAAGLETHRGGESFPGENGRMRQESERAFPAPPKAPPGSE